MTKIKILVVDDEDSMLALCADALRGLPDAEVSLENRSSRAAERLTNESFDLLISDLRMPEVNGIELLGQARQSDPGMAALIITALT